MVLYRMFKEKCFQIYPILESKYIKIDNIKIPEFVQNVNNFLQKFDKLDNLIEMNLRCFQFDSFIISE